MKTKIISLAIACAMLSSCATMFGSSNNNAVKVSTNVQDGKLYVDGRYYGATTSGTTLVSLDGENGHVVTIKKDGFEPVTIPVNRTIQGAYYFNIPLVFFLVVPGIVGFVVDGATGNMYKYQPINIMLDK